MTRTLFSQHFKNTVSNKKIHVICKKSADVLRGEIRTGKLAAIDVIFSTQDLREFEKFAKKISVYKKVLVLGVGGSSLGGKTLCSLKSQTRVEFIESIDPTTLAECLSKLDFKNTFFLVISKSGETIETICQTLVILAELQRQEVKNFSKQFLFVTVSERNSLAKIAKKIGAEITSHPNQIGGRYSCFSIVGLLPAMLVGLDAKKIRSGAKKVVQSFLQEDVITDSCVTQLTAFEQGFVNNVVMPYIDGLKNFTDWYRQLWAESLGKNGFGSTPINSMGTVDQHSQLQLYLDGPKDKFFTFITTKKQKCDFLIRDLPGCETLFGEKRLSEIIAVEQETTIEVLHQRKLPIRIFETAKFNEEILGGLMMQMLLETILIAYVKGINPFDQPAVELRKDLAKKLLKNE